MKFRNCKEMNKTVVKTHLFVGKVVVLFRNLLPFDGERRMQVEIPY